MKKLSKYGILSSQRKPMPQSGFKPRETGSRALASNLYEGSEITVITSPPLGDCESKVCL